MSIFLLFTHFLQIFFLPNRSYIILSNDIIYRSLYALQVSEDIKYILNNVFSNKKM